MTVQAFGAKLVRLEETTSTNDVAKQYAADGAEEGIVVVAKVQTKGRGRQGRVWIAAPGQSLLLSVVLRPPWDDSTTAWLGVLAGVAVAETARELGLQGVALKWPNDVLVHGRKLAGVLVEPRISGGRIEFSVIGVGMNVLQEETDWPPELRGQATSFAREGVNVSVDAVQQALLKRLHLAYVTVLSAGLDPVMSSWRSWTGSERLPTLT